MVCFVPGCKSGNSSKDKPHLMRIAASASADMRAAWLKNIPKQEDKVFKLQTDHLCHKHFEEKYIVKTFTVMMGSQVIAEEPRKRWKLTENAVPTIFSNAKVPKYYDRKLVTRKPPKHRIMSFPPKKVEISPVPVNNNPAVEDVTLEVNVNPVNLDIKQIKLLPGWILQEDFDSFTFYKLVMDKRTNIPTFHAERSIIITSRCPPVIYIRNKLMTHNYGPVTTSEETARLIQHVDEMIICPGVPNYNMFSTVDDGYRCGNGWCSSGCTQTSMDGCLCEYCLQMKTGLKNKAQLGVKINQYSKSRKVVNRAALYQKKNKNHVRCIRRIKSRLGSISSALKTIQRQFTDLDETLLEEAISREENLPHQMKIAMITAANAAKAKSKHGVRYQSEWILQALLLKICSPKAYRHLRENKILPLPHPQYLTSLLSGLPCQFGFNEFIFQCLKNEFEGKSRRDRQFMLIFDEMKIRESVTYDKASMRFTGYIDYGEFSNEGKTTRSKKLEADHALVFMCRCLNSKMTQPIACFATRGSAPGTILAKMMISCISRLEEVGCEVVGVISDGATNNKSAWKTLGISGNAGFVKNHITNPRDESRCVYFFCDVPHIVKCMRNHIHKAGLVKYGEYSVNWGFYKALYDTDKKHDVRVAPKLTDQHINPNPFQKMVVSFATQIFSKSVADGLQFYRDKVGNNFFKYSEGTEKFTRAINDLFDACNARAPKEGVRKNSRKYKIIQDFLTTMREEDTYASAVTLASIRVTLKSTLELIDYLCDVIGFDYVLTAKFNQDCLENFFGLLRSLGGDDCHPTASSFSHLFRLLSVYMPTSKILKGNVRVHDECSVLGFVDSLKEMQNSVRIDRMNESDKIRDKIVSRLTDENLNQQSSNPENPDSSQVSSLRCTVFNVCGFLVHKAKNFTDCGECIGTLECDDMENYDSMLIQVKDLGQLRYPCKPLFNLIYNNVEPKIVMALDNEKTRVSTCIFSSIVSSLDSIHCAGIGSCPNHSQSLVVGLIRYYISLRLYFFSKNQNKELRSSTETKKKMKEAKLS